MLGLNCDYSINGACQSHGPTAHYGEVFGVVGLGDAAAEYPGEATIAARAETICKGCYRGYVHDAYEGTAWSFIMPNSDYWDAGVTSAVCILIAEDGKTQFTGSRRAPA